MSTSRGKILVVDDDPEVADAHVGLVKGLGYSARPQSNPDLVEHAVVDDPQIRLLLLDLRMPGQDGLEVLRRVKIRRPDVGVVLATVVNDIEKAVHAVKSGAYNYLLKPLQEERLARVLESFFRNRPRGLTEDPRFASFVTGAAPMEEVFRTLRIFAEAEVPVLVQGETGTGKELAARLVHTLSPRAPGPFTGVNVAALPPNLFEAELFGYRRGAFTGALVDHAGYFESAGTGTLFLDEIGDLGSDQQKILLRVLQERRYRRIGETEERELGARLVMATNRDLRADVADGRFREDLYYRLTGHAVTLPPLRERPGDVRVLADYFLAKYASQFGRQLDGFEPGALATLERYPFPGNVRELENLVSAAVLVEQGPAISATTLPRHVRGIPMEESQATYLATLAALRKSEGNISVTAKILGINRATLYRRLEGYKAQGLPIPE